jgi:hypothetical protein
MFWLLSVGEEGIGELLILANGSVYPIAAMRLELHVSADGRPLPVRRLMSCLSESEVCVG